MASDWLASSIVEGPVLDGGSMLGGPPRVVWHSTESDPGSIAGVVAWLKAQSSSSHLVWDPSTGEIVQLIAGSRAARALEHPAGTPQTNRAGSVCVQVEVVGWAAHPFTARPLRGRDQLLTWLDSFGVPRRSAPPGRMSWAAWAGFSGHCGHLHVPGQTHIDPGAIDWPALLATAPQTDEEDGLNPIYEVTDGPAKNWQIYDYGSGPVHIDGPESAELTKAGVRMIPISGVTFANRFKGVS